MVFKTHNVYFFQLAALFSNPRSFQVIIEGTVGSSSSEFVAVDDINLTSNACVISTQPVG